MSLGGGGDLITPNIDKNTDKMFLFKDQNKRKKSHRADQTGRKPPHAAMFGFLWQPWALPSQQHTNTSWRSPHTPEGMVLQRVPRHSALHSLVEGTGDHQGGDAEHLLPLEITSTFPLSLSIQLPSTYFPQDMYILGRMLSQSHF